MITAREIEALLALKHHKDIFIPQCKNGCTHAAMEGELLKLDAWTIPKSWANFAMTGYEIKVSRQDFLRDEKWRKALPLCNLFYWVAPQGLIDPSEVSPECGLMVVSKNGQRLFIKKKAVFREVKVPQDLFVYVLMCRTRIKHEDEVISKSELWKSWMEKRDEDKYLGSSVSKKIRRLVEERILKVEHENGELRWANQLYAETEKILEKHGLLVEQDGIKRPSNIRGIEQKIHEICSVVPVGFVEKLREIADVISGIQKQE